jgi:hypothetical protein
MKMLLLSPVLVTQSLIEKAVLLTLVNKRLKSGPSCSSCVAQLNRLFSNKARLSSFSGLFAGQWPDQEA